MSPYHAILGEAFDTLHPNVRRAHEAPLSAEGTFDVVHGTHRVTRILVALMKLPAAGNGVPVALSVVFGPARTNAGPLTLRWERRIGRTPLSTHQHAHRGFLVEEKGPGRMVFSLRAANGCLLYEHAALRFLFLRVPPVAVSARSGPRVARSGRLARRRQSGVARPSHLRVRGKNAAIAGGTVNTAIWLLFVQALLGAFDTLYYHEYRLRLPHGHGAGTELRLHAARDFAYAVIIGSLGFLTWNGSLAWVLVRVAAGRDWHHALGFHRRGSHPPATWR